ncbi:MAG: diacylglycerol kinase family protein [Flavobacteriaceae bacterium]|nr:diacylglycerol kinase family protein [Flavobacteriaceae bacterium]
MHQHPKDNFFVDRWKSLGYAIRGFFLLIKTENAVKVHFSFAVLFVIIGVLCRISSLEWAIQLLCFGLILSVESLNTAVEKTCDFIHPDFHDRIGFIKDISAGAVTFAVGFAYAALVFIYLIKI